jgi:hypothetical protein
MEYIYQVMIQYNHVDSAYSEITFALIQRRHFPADLVTQSQKKPFPRYAAYAVDLNVIISALTQTMKISKDAH